MPLRTGSSSLEELDAKLTTKRLIMKAT